jgi:hypothetical protein
MPSFLIRVLLFLSSYFPLGLIFFVMLIGTKPILAWSFLSAGILGVLGLALYLAVTRRLNPLSVEVLTVTRRDGEAMSYVVTYLLPFLGAPFGSIEQGIGLAIFFVVLAVLYINSDMIHINPTLNLVGFHVYEVELANGEVQSLIARRRPRKGQRIATVAAGEGVLLEVRK